MKDLMRHTAFLLFALITAGIRPSQAQADLVPGLGERVVITGEAWLESLAADGYLETMVQTRFPGRRLSFRHVTGNARTPEGTGQLLGKLHEAKPDILVVGLGSEEARGGQDAYPDFKRTLARLLGELRSRHFNGRSPARLILVGPLGALGTDETKQASDKDLKLYSFGIEETAAVLNLPFVNLYQLGHAATKEQPSPSFQQADGSLTHYGSWAVAMWIARAAGWSPEPWKMRIQGPSSGATFQFSTELDQMPSCVPVMTGSMHPSLASNLPQLSVQGLPQGTFALYAEGQPLVSASQSQWSAGVLLNATPSHQQSEALRRAITARNRVARTQSEGPGLNALDAGIWKEVQNSAPVTYTLRPMGR